jgi:hypothetical protein
MSEAAAIDSPPRIEILYFDGCPNHEAFLPHLHDLLTRHGLAADIVTTRVDSDQDAQRLAFLGSPTVRINGGDVDPDAEPRTGYGMQCRLYRTPDGLTGTPPDAWILSALRPHL